MLSSITPLGERGRQRRWGATVTAYVVASMTTGSALGAVLGLVPAPPRDVALLVVAGCCLLAAVLDLRPALLPTVRRQVNEDWLSTYRGWACGAGFGLQLGLGVVTIVTTGAVYATFAAAAVSGSWRSGAVVGATFGLVRAAPSLLLRGVTTTPRLVAVSQRLDGWAAPAHRSTVAALTAVGIGCAALAAVG